MADRVSASIVIGGKLTVSLYEALADIITSEGLSTEWDGPAFEPEHRAPGESLSLYAHEVAWGRFEVLEAWCVTNKLTFSRWSGAYPGQWGAERVVFTGYGEPSSYPADEDDHVMLAREMAEKLGSIEAIIGYFNAADIAVPPLDIVTEPINCEAGL